MRVPRCLPIGLNKGVAILRDRFFWKNFSSCGRSRPKICERNFFAENLGLSPDSKKHQEMR